MNSSIFFSPILAALCVLAAIASAEAQKMPVTDQEFVEEATMAGQTEVDLANLALAESVNPSVRSFAERMIIDHEKAGKELAALAAEEKLKVAPEPKVDSPLMEQLRSRDGAEFDRAYATRMVQEHQEAVALFRQAAQQDDLRPAVKRFAAATLPTIEAHLEHAMGLQKELGAKAPSSAGDAPMEAPQQNPPVPRAPKPLPDMTLEPAGAPTR